MIVLRFLIMLAVILAVALSAGSFLLAPLLGSSWVAALIFGFPIGFAIGHYGTKLMLPWVLGS